MRGSQYPVLPELPETKDLIAQRPSIEPNTNVSCLPPLQINDMIPNDTLLYLSSHHQRGFLWQQIGAGAETDSQILCRKTKLEVSTRSPLRDQGTMKKMERKDYRS